MTDTTQRFECDASSRVVAFTDAIRTKPMAGIDPKKWQTLCCPNCGRRLETVYVDRE